MFRNSQLSIVSPEFRCAWRSWAASCAPGQCMACWPRCTRVRALTAKPVATPLALVPFGEGMAFGRTVEGETLHGEYRQHLMRVLEGGFVRFPLP